MCDDVTDPAVSRTVSYAYTNGFLTSVPGYASAITYHPNGALHQIVHANSAVVTHGKDPNDMVRPAWIQLPGSSTSSYTYDGSGNVKALSGETYAYDGVSRLKTAILSAGERHDYTYDAFGNLSLIDRTPNSLGIGDQSIPVSPATNRLSAGSYDGSGNLVVAPAGQTYAYDALDMVTSTSGGAAFYVYTANDERLGTLRPLGGGDREEIWRLRDLNGQLLRGWERMFNSSAPWPGLPFEDSFESGDLSCWSWAVGGSVAGSCPTAPPPPHNAGSWIWSRDYVHRQGLLLATHSPLEGTLHYHLDHLGTPRSVTNSMGGLFSQHRYFPFGEETAGSGPVSADAMPLRFTGHERDFHDPPDFEEDVDYMHARYYRALYGRFLSVDPVVSSSRRRPQSWNQYAYVYGNPMNYVDPYGLFGAPAWCVTPNCITVTARDPWANSINTISISRPPGSGPPDLGGLTLLEFARVAAAANPQPCSDPGCRMLEIAGSADDDAILNAIEAAGELEVVLVAGVGGRVRALRPMRAHGRVGQAIRQSRIANRLFGKGSYLNRGQYLRIGFGRRGGEMMFRVTGRLVGNRKIDILRLGPL